MTESNVRELIGEVLADANSSSAVDLVVVNAVTASNISKNDIIKVSEEGVAKLTFSFLDDMQGGDSSLEPGEVKTPPPGSSPVVVKESTPSRLAQVVHIEPPAKQLAKETLAKALKTVSQLEAEACEEKVRAILELDAKRRKEEAEKKKLEEEKRRQSGEIDIEVERKRKAKEERRKLKKLKKAKKAAEKILAGCEEDGSDDNTKTLKNRLSKNRTESEESEGLCSSGDDDDHDEMKSSTTDKHNSSVLNSAIAMPVRYPPHLPPPPHIMQEAFLSGYRPLNPFMRGPRPDFAHGRGGFIPRGRGGMRGRMPFQGFRPPFFANTGSMGPGGSGTLKFNVPHGSHVGQQQQRHHTPPPNRGHSPILPPTSDLQWTKCKPSISFAFKFEKDQKLQSVYNTETKLQHSNRKQSGDEYYWDDGKNDEDGNDKFKDDSDRHSQHKKNKKHKSTSKEKKKSKKHKGKDSKRSKKRIPSQQALLVSSVALIKQKPKSNKSNRRKIEKIRKSYGSTSRSTPTLQQQQHHHALSDAKTSTKHNRNDNDDEETEDKSGANTENESDKIPNEEEIRSKIENIKKEKIETTELKIEDLTLKVKPLIMVKTEPDEQEKDIQKDKNEEENIEKVKESKSQSFDIFADSPPPRCSEATPTSTAKLLQEKGTLETSGIVTPPLPVYNKTIVQKTPPLHSTIEIQKRIDKLLQQDDIKLEAIEAAKDLLLKKTQIHQSSKEGETQTEKDTRKIIEQNLLHSSKTISDNSGSKEKPKTYKDKESSKKSNVSEKEKREKDKESKQKESSWLKDKSKDSCKDDKKNRDHDKKESDRDQSHKEFGSRYRNPFKRSISRDRFFGKIDSHRLTRTKSRERDYSDKRRLSHDRRWADTSCYISSRISTKRRTSGSSLNSSKSGERETKGSLESLCSKEKDRKDKTSNVSPEVKQKRKLSLSPKRKTDKESIKSHKVSKSHDQDHNMEMPSRTPPPKLIKKNVKTPEKSKETKKSKSLLKPVSKKRPLSFTQTEFLFPEEGNENDFIIGDDEETNDSFKNLKSSSDKEDSPDTDDYMDNWENDEDVDIDMNSNLPADISTTRKTSPDITEDDSFVTRFVNPSPPSELLQEQAELENKNVKDNQDALLPLTPPLDLLKKPQGKLKDKEEEKRQQIDEKSDESQELKKTELFGMQEIYDQFIKSVEASGVNMKTTDKIEKLNTLEESENIVKTEIATHNQSEDPMSASSTSASSSTSSSSSSSSDTNSSSNSSTTSSSASSSEDSNDGNEFKKSIKRLRNKSQKQAATIVATISSSDIDDKPNDFYDTAAETQLNKNDTNVEREPRTPSPTPLQKTLLTNQTPPTPVTQQNKSTPKSDVAKDFKKLKNLEANLSRIQMMRANYDSNDEISEELHKMEILFLQEKKLILQKYAKNAQQMEKPNTSKENTTAEFIPALPTNDFSIQPPPPPPSEEPNNIFDANREAIKLTISPLKLPSKPAIFNTSLTEETEKRANDDKDEIDFTEKLVKPVKEVAIVKPMMETKESKESRSRDYHRHRRSPVYGSRERQRSPNNYRDRNRRSSSRSRVSPQRRGRGRSLSLSPPRRGVGNVRHGTPPRRGAPGSRLRLSNRRSRSRSRSPLRQFGNRRGKESSPFRTRKRGQLSDFHTHKKFSRHRNSRSRSPQSPQTRPRSPRTPPPRRRSYSQDPYSRSPLPFKPPSPPMRRSLSPTNSNSSQSRRSRSPSPHRPRSPRSPPSPRSPLSPRSPRSPRSPDSSPSHRYEDRRYRRDSSFERHSSISPSPQYYATDSGVSSQASSYYYNVSPNRISLDARINIVLNTPTSGADTPPASYEGYTNYAHYSGAAYMSLPPQPMTDPSNNMGYFQNPYVPVMPPRHDVHHHTLPPPNSHPMHAAQQHLPQHLQHPPAYSNIPTISSGITGTAASSPLPPANFYYNDFNVTQHQPLNPVLKELPKAPVAVQKGNVLEIVPSSVDSAVHSSLATKTKVSPEQTEVTNYQNNKASTVSWKNEANNRHEKSADSRQNREGNDEMRSILKRAEAAEKPYKPEKKKVYFEDGICPSRDSDDEDRKLIEMKIRKKVLRLRKKRGIDIPAARDLVGEKSRVKQEKPKMDSALEKLPPPPPPNILTPSNIEQPIYLRPPTPVPLVYFHFDSVVHSMYVSQLEKPIPPRLLNPKCVPPGAMATTSTSSGPGGGLAAGGSATNSAATQSPNHNSTCGPLTTTKKELTTLAAMNRVSRNENLLNSPKMGGGDPKRESPNLPQHSPTIPINKPSVGSGGMHFAPTQTSPQMLPLQAPPAIRHPPSPIGFVGMRINNFMRLPPSPLVRTAIPPHMQTPPPNMINMPPGASHHPMMPMRHPQYNMPPPNLMPIGRMSPDINYNPALGGSGNGGGGSPYANIQTPPPGFHGYHPRPMNPGFFMGTPPATHTIHTPPPMLSNPPHMKDKDHMLYHHQHHHHPHHANKHLHPQSPQPHHQHKPPLPPPPHVGSNNAAGASPQAMIAPFNVNKTVN